LSARSRQCSASSPSSRIASSVRPSRSEEHTSELQSREKLVCRLLLEKKNRGTVRERHRSAPGGGNTLGRRERTPGGCHPAGTRSRDRGGRLDAQALCPGRRDARRCPT